MALKCKELCKRTRASDGAVSYHVVSDSGNMREVSLDVYRDFELRAVRTDTFHGRSNQQYQWQYKTVHYI